MEEELLVLNTLVYVKGVFVNVDDKTEKSVYSIISKIDEDKIEYSPNILSPEQWEDVKKTVLDNPDIYDNLTIRNVETKYEARSVTITDDKNNMYVIYQGTGDGHEWNDNGVGAHANVTGTVVQNEALDYFDRMVETYGEGKNIYVSGHSKGGNKAQYVGVLRGSEIEHVYSFDGQGFSRAFVNRYQDEIDIYADKITNICNEFDYINVLLNPIAGETRYVSSNTDLGDLVNDFLGSVLKQHSPITMFSYDEDGNLDGLGDETSQNEFLCALGDMFRYYERYMDEEDWEYLCHLIMHQLEGDTCYSLDSSHEYNFDFDDMPDGFIENLASLTAGYLNTVELDDNIIKLITDAFIKKLLGNNIFSNIFSTALVSLVQSGISTVAEVYNSRVRDFSDNCRQELLNLVKETEKEKWWDITKWEVWYKLEDILGGLGFPEDNNSLNEYYRKLIDINNESAESINKIFEEVKRIEGEYNDSLQSISDELNDLLVAFQEIENSIRV